MRLFRQTLWLTAILFSIGASATTFDKQALTNKLEKNLNAQVSDIQPSDVEGLLEVHTSKGVIFTSKDGEYFIAGKLYHFTPDGRYEDVIAKRQEPINAKKIAALKDQMIEYKAKNEKYAVTVFTDYTCGYCMKLHSEMKEYNDLGITIRYLAFPREGLNGQVAANMAAIWCADDQKKALDDAKGKKIFPARNDKFATCKSEVDNQYKLGVEMGMRGTPAIFLPDGKMLGGYLPPQQLLATLKQTQS